MDYKTTLDGCLRFNKPVAKDFFDYLNAFCTTKRMKRNVEKIKEMDQDWRLHCFRGELGIDGEYYIQPESLPARCVQGVPMSVWENPDMSDRMMAGYAGQLADVSVEDYNRPPGKQPGLWCKWKLSKTDSESIIEWNGDTSYWYYTEWLDYLIESFIKPTGYSLNGTVAFRGDNPEDFGEIIVENNQISIMA